nr:MAG TPA: hypothetical protein [Caudoviricetes sp.]
MPPKTAPPTTNLGAQKKHGGTPVKVAGSYHANLRGN